MDEIAGPPLRPALTSMSPVIHGARNYSELAHLALNPDTIIDFSANSNPYGPHPVVLQAVREAISESTLARYPDRDCLVLSAAIATAEEVTINRVLPGNGAAELIQLIALALVTPGSCHLVIAPTFGEYSRAIQLLGGIPYEYRPASKANLRFDVEEIATTIQHVHPDGVWLCNPNNPTGQQWTAAELTQLQAADPTNRVLWVIDESYRYFTPSPTPLENWAAGHNVIILRSLTKEHALAGLRLGYILAAPKLVEMLRLVQPPWSVNSLAQVAGVAAMQESVLAWRQQSLIRLHQHAAELWAGLRALDFTVLPTNTTYALVEVGDAATFRYNLLRQGLLVRDCTSFGLPGYVRIAARQPAENERLLAAIKMEQEKVVW